MGDSNLNSKISRNTRSSSMKQIQALEKKLENRDLEISNLKVVNSELGTIHILRKHL